MGDFNIDLQLGQYKIYFGKFLEPLKKIINYYKRILSNDAVRSFRTDGYEIDWFKSSVNLLVVDDSLTGIYDMLSGGGGPLDFESLFSCTFAICIFSKKQKAI